MNRLLLALLPVVAVAAGSSAPSAPAPREKPLTDWPMLGGTPGRNMANFTDTGLVVPAKGPDWEDKAASAAWEKQWLQWKAELGSRSYGGPVVAGGRVFVGTNNERPRNPRDAKANADGEVEPIDKGILMCLDRRTGQFLWQAVFDKLERGAVGDWPKEGICSTPAVVGDRVYFVSNRCTVVCADVRGFADGNQGMMTEKYQTPTDADILWEFDMIKQLDVFPHNMTQCSPLIVGDVVFVGTSNGVDEGHINLPSPDAPSLIALDRNTGKLLWKDNSPGKMIMHGQWAHPAFAADPVPQVIFPGGDGWLRAHDPATGKILWKFDCNPKGSVYELGGTGTKNPFVLVAPVVANGRVYVGVGDDPEHIDGIGHLWCIDLKRAVEKGRTNKDADVSAVANDFDPTAAVNKNSALVWHFGGEERRPWAVRDYLFGRTLGSACVVDGLVYMTESNGYVHCLDAVAGQPYWQFDTKSQIWGSCYFADGRVFVANDSGELFVFRHDKKPEVIDPLDFFAGNAKDARALRKVREKLVAEKYLAAKIEFDAPSRTTPVVAGGVLYVQTENTLYAIGKR